MKEQEENKEISRNDYLTIKDAKEICECVPQTILNIIKRLELEVEWYPGPKGLIRLLTPEQVEIIQKNINSRRKYKTLAKDKITSKDKNTGLTIPKYTAVTPRGNVVDITLVKTPKKISLGKTEIVPEELVPLMREKEPSWDCAFSNDDEYFVFRIDRGTTEERICGKVISQNYIDKE